MQPTGWHAEQHPCWAALFRCASLQSPAPPAWAATLPPLPTWGAPRASAELRSRPAARQRHGEACARAQGEGSL